MQYYLEVNLFNKEINEIEKNIEKMENENKVPQSIYQLFDLRMSKELLGKDNILSLGNKRSIYKIK